ncbi:hypothetical protein [Gillisia hiemivivida]|jgi:hypothetical protein|uniref:Lipocalin-like domain-containing protein n=1 Tax=Gillisia hiemivivida TaxID=291190 RepID=A0A5C6ZU26_9FLAO|nr:hypothetical protein [Gillisia hiemivivida]TXD93921.1 hypothetical protein ES724_08340 [Gillisia hiemivivida]
MKQIIILSFIAGLFLTTSCSKEDLNERDLVNKWHLIEALADPGDGRGVFQKVESDAIIEFFDGNTVRYSNSFCAEGNSVNTGIYSSIENKIYPDCNQDLPLSYKIESNRLIIYYNCIEGCAEKFELVK